MRFRCSLAVMLLAAFLVGRSAQGQTPVTDVAHIGTTAWVEGIRYAQTGYEILQRATTIANQIQQIYYQVQTLRKLDFHSWRDIGPLLTSLDGILVSAEGITYRLNDLEEVFHEAFPGAELPVNFPDAHFQRAFRTLGTIRAALLGLKELAIDSNTSLGQIALAKEQLSSAVGTEQALEAIGQFIGWQTEQLVALQTTIQLAANAEMVGSAHRINQEAQDRQVSIEVFRATLAAALAGSGEPPSSYSLLPEWMPR
jgi:type IV secretion system protein TrbJ